jgi:hypothetical protein
LPHAHRHDLRFGRDAAFRVRYEVIVFFYFIHVFIDGLVCLDLSYREWKLKGSDFVVDLPITRRLLLEILNGLFTAGRVLLLGLSLGAFVRGDGLRFGAFLVGLAFLLTCHRGGGDASDTFHIRHIVVNQREGRRCLSSHAPSRTPNTFADLVVHGLDVRFNRIRFLVQLVDLRTPLGSHLERKLPIKLGSGGLELFIENVISFCCPLR